VGSPSEIAKIGYGSREYCAFRIEKPEKACIFQKWLIFLHWIPAIPATPDPISD
jgi:hypothetical protein